MMEVDGLSLMKGKGCDSGKTETVLAEMERYITDHPGSPAAVRRPQLSVRGPTCVALLGKSLDDGIVGFGDTVWAALRAFDRQYLRNLHPPRG